MDDKTILGITAIIALLILESWALYLGYNGALFFPVVVVIASLTGYEFHDEFKECLKKIKR